MTIVVGVAAPDGLILAGDSRTTLTVPNGPHRILSDSAQKVFKLNGFGIATAGEALIDTKTIAGLVDEFAAATDPFPTEIDGFADALGAFFQDHLIQWYTDQGNPWKPADGFKLAFIVGGYDTAGVGHLKEVRVPGDSAHEVLDLGVSTTTPGWYPQGETDVVTRLMAGFDRQRMAAANVALTQEVSDALQSFEYTSIPPAALQDAVDLAQFLIRTTIDTQRFTYGTVGDQGAMPTCGGQVSILSVRRRGAEWVERWPLTAGSRPGKAEGAR